MKVLAIDFGTKRVGLATGDTDIGVALPFKSVPAERAIDFVAHAADAEGVHRVVVGLPIGLDGKETERSVQVRQFVVSLKERLPTFPIELEDERMTTAMVERMRRDAGIKKSDFDPDAAAAVAILETYMQRHATE